MKVLYYNWDYIDGNSGGGVSGYQRNLFSEMVKLDDYTLYYLNSGLSYDNCGLRIVETRNSFGSKVRSFEIMNSPVLAPVQQSGKNLKTYLKDTTLYYLLLRFIGEEGPFDVIHFNNLEGLSIETLRLKEVYPQTKFIYSVHNYFPICSRVNLWKDEACKNGHNCDKSDYSECISCYKKRNYKATVQYRKTNEHSKLFKFVKKIRYKFITSFFKDKEQKEYYEDFEKKNVYTINKYIDVVIAVSDRVRQILLEHGFDKNKTVVSYIGTKVADKQLGRSNALCCEDSFTIGYMGYMRADKGFYFFLEALEKLPDDLAKEISIRIIAKYSPYKQKNEVKRILKLKKKYYAVELINGYNMENQKDLLQGMNLGIVPVLWEDNLPQVVIEQMAYGVPVLVSNLGGAKELIKNSDFIFQGGDVDDFMAKLIHIINNRELLSQFWDKCAKLTLMKEHVNELRRLYDNRYSEVL